MTSQQAIALDLIRTYDRALPIRGNVLSCQLRVSERTVRELVAELRGAGYPICSGDRGYYMAQTAQEARECYLRLRSHALAELAAIKALKRRMHETGEAML